MSRLCIGMLLCCCAGVTAAAELRFDGSAELRRSSTQSGPDRQLEIRAALMPQRESKRAGAGRYEFDGRMIASQVGTPCAAAPDALFDNGFE